MTDCIVLLHGEDIAAAQQIARDLPSAEVVVFDPVLVDRARAAGFAQVRLLPYLEAPAYADLHERSHAAASALERQLNALVATVNGAVSIEGWQHLTLYYLYMSLGWYAGLAASLVPQLHGRKLHVLVCDNPASYYFNAFVPALLVLQQAQAQGIDAAAYNYGSKPEPSRLLPMLDGSPRVAGAEFLLTHLPTCFYDIPYFNDEFKASGKRIVNLEAKHFGVPVAAAESIALAQPEALAQVIAPGWLAEVERIEAALAAQLHIAFADKIPSPRYRARQVDLLVAGYRSQWLSLRLLERYFAAAPPSKLLLSDHDTGLHGPLLAFAQIHHLPVLLLPHSKTTPDSEFSGPNTVALVHPIQGEHIRDRHGKRILHQPLALPIDFSASNRFPARLRRVALMLNAFSLGGIYFAQYRPYLDGIARIAQWCREHGTTLDIRCKPSYGLIHLLASELGLDAASLTENATVTMAEFAARCDLCLMYDTPTAGALAFLNQGIAILNPLFTPPTQPQRVTTHPDVVPRESIEQTLQRLHGFVTDPVLLQQFRWQQFQRYVQLFDKAQPLRVYL